MSRTLSAAGLSLLGLLILVTAALWHYDGNVSALLHMDATFGTDQGVASGVVLYTDGGYDGMAYYQIARDVPALFFGGEITFDSPYRFQRILFPLLGFLLSLGQDEWLPLAFLVINLLAAIGSFLLLTSITKKVNVHTLTVLWNPAILVGLLFSLTEPVSIFFILLFFWLFERSGRRIDLASVLALTLSLLARETTIFLIVLLGLWFLWKRQWKDALYLALPILLMFGWQVFLEIRFGDIGFQANNNVIDPPFVGVWYALQWAMTEQGIQQMYRFSSLALLAVVLPLFVLLSRDWLRKRTRIGLLPFLLSGLTVTMLCMDSHMWGVITSIGRVVTPFYPVYALFASERDSGALRLLSLLLILVSCTAAIGIAWQMHPYILS